MDKEATHEFKSETSVLDRIFHNPDIFQSAECSLICTVLREVCKQAVVHQCHWPEVVDTREDGTTFFIHRA